MSSAFELGGDEPPVEAEVVGDEDGTVEPFEEVASNLTELGGVEHLAGGDAVDVGRTDVAFGVHEG